MPHKLFQEQRSQETTPVKSVAIKNRFVGYGIALGIGILMFVSGLTNPSTQGDSLVAGLVVILGALAYGSAKKRKLGLAKHEGERRVLEVFAVVIAMGLILFQSDLADRMYENPFVNVFIPAWVLIAYFVVIFKKPTQL